MARKRMVIFGCGYLGRRVARVALDSGMEVCALTRNANQAEELSRDGVGRVIVAELHNSGWHGAIDPRQDFVLDCVGSGGSGLEGYRTSYLEGMRSILQWASSGEVGDLVFTSSTSVYAQDHGGWVTEADPAEGASEGGVILRETEMLLQAAPTAARRSFILRLGGIYGPGRHRLLDMAMRGVRPGEGDDVLLNSIHVDDVVSAIFAAFKSDSKGIGGVYNIVDGSPVSKREIIEHLFARSEELELRGTEPVSESMLAGRPPGRRTQRRISNLMARAELGWSPVYPNCKQGYEALLNNLVRLGGCA